MKDKLNISKERRGINLKTFQHSERDNTWENKGCRILDAKENDIENTMEPPICKEAIQKKKNINKLQRTECLISIKRSKAYRTVSYEAFGVIAGVKSICIKIDEIVKIIQSNAWNDRR